MNKKKILGAAIAATGVIALILGAFATVIGQDEDATTTIVIEFRGRAVGEMREIPPIPGTGTSEGLCFDVEMFDLTTNEVVGMGTDCLADITSDDGGIALNQVTFFNFEGGRIVAPGMTSVVPVTQDTGETGYTHITGAIPEAGENNIIEATGIYEGISGSVRLAGAADLSLLGSDGEMGFACIFVITLDGEI